MFLPGWILAPSRTLIRRSARGPTRTDAAGPSERLASRDASSDAGSSTSNPLASTASPIEPCPPPCRCVAGPLGRAGGIGCCAEDYSKQSFRKQEDRWCRRLALDCFGRCATAAQSSRPESFRSHRRTGPAMRHSASKRSLARIQIKESLIATGSWASGGVRRASSPCQARSNPRWLASHP